MNEQLETSSGLDESALATRLRIAELASTDQYGAINHSWLVLHIWLAQCDMVRSDHLRRNGKDTRTVNPSESLLSEYRRLFSLVLPTVLPLMHEFFDPEMFRVWREAGYFEEPADDPRFIACALSVGLPISAEDLIYADTIVREALSVGADIIDLRSLCTEFGDYSEKSPIEPSVLGGQKIAVAIHRWLRSSH